MRLWHKKLISVLPQKQLISQWRECSAIASDIAKKQKVRSPLVSKILAYPFEDTQKYIALVKQEILKRGFTIKKDVLTQFTEESKQLFSKTKPTKNIYRFWHNRQYLKQCYYNLQEKFDCNMISKEEWQKIKRKIHR